MKLNIFSILTIICLGAGVKASAQDISDPGQYMSAIQKEQVSISKKYMAYTSASAHGKREKKVDALREKLMDQIQNSRENIGGLPAWKGDKSYRDTAVSFMKFYYNIMNDDYAKIINMEEIAEQSYDDMSAYLLTEEKVDQKLTEANGRMQDAQKQFAAKNNITLHEDESDLAGMLKEVHGTNKYYHQVYLLFFKPYIQEKHLLEATGKGNLTGLEQSKSAMQKYATEGLAALPAIPGLNGDNSLVQACKRILTFYSKEAEKMAAVNDYFLAKEKFDGLKKEWDKKSEHSKNEVNDYNKAVNDMNKSGQAYNNTSKDLNDQRNDSLKDWNDAVNSFFAEHTPKYK